MNARQFLTVFCDALMNPSRTLLARILLFGFAFLVLAGCESLSDKSGKNAYRKFHFSLFSYNVQSDGKQCRAEWRRAPALAPSLWRRIESRYQLPNSTTNPRILTERRWYTSHQAYLNRVSARASRYLHYVAGQLEARNLPGELALLPIVESAYNPFAVSTSNASGLWQFIPGTAKHLKMDMNWWYDSRRDIPVATNKALDYLVFLRDHYDGDWLKALAAYNAGWGTIDKAVAKNRARGLPTDYWSLDVPAETAAYVPKLLALAQISQHPETYGINWAYIPDLPYFAEVHFSGQIDVGFAADLAQVDSDEMHLLNPGISRWATPPGGPYRLLVPIDQANDLQERIANMSSSDLMPNTSANTTDSFNPHVQALEDKAARNPKNKSSNGSTSSASIIRSSGSNSGGSTRSYTVKSGDTLWSVAKRTGVSASTLRQLNGLGASDTLKLGQTLALSSSSSSKASGASSKRSRSTSTSDGRVHQTFEASSRSNATERSSKSSSKASSTSKKKTTYTVKSGDTLMAISRKYKVPVEDIKRWNGFSKSSAVIKPGQRINLNLD
ncbi:MAG: LysM peptidoglycan-binding domain-containing protein [Pseudomonadales bacterium]